MNVHCKGFNIQGVHLEQNILITYFSDSSPIPSGDVFTLMSLCIIVNVQRGFRAKSSQ
jgi:hypothetical protein